MTITNSNITIPGTVMAAAKNDFEELYISLRKKEKRIYTDEQLASLPDIEVTHPHAGEWKTRKRSAGRLYRHLQQKKRPLSILEVGCGNGWLIAKMATLENVRATGIDINTMELAQAKKVFSHYPNLTFIAADIENGWLRNRKFDVIIFAAALQYFPSSDTVLRLSLAALNEGGEIHILDSIFYPTAEVENAALRTLNYYRSIGFESMAKYYFHLPKKILERFHTKLLYDPSTFINRIFRKQDRFPWIMISKKL